MIAATTLAIFVVPVLFVLISKISYGKKIKAAQVEAISEKEVDKQIIQNNL